MSVQDRVGYTVTELLMVKTVHGRPGSMNAGEVEREERELRHYWFTG